MENKKYLTVAEFAENVGVSKQRIYQSLKTRKFKGLFKTLNGVTMIDSKAFFLYESKPLEQDFTKKESKPLESDTEKTQENSESKPIEQGVEQPLENIINTLNDTLSILREQLAIKDEQLKQANKTNETLIKLLDQQQQLTAMQHKQLESHSPQQEQKKKKKQNRFLKIFRK